jgi:nucleotide-binding universal stress UspA family protein
MFKRILVPYDGSSLAESAFPLALKLAQCVDAKIILLGVGRFPSGQRGGIFKTVSAAIPDVRVPETPQDVDRDLHPVTVDSQMASLESEIRKHLVHAAKFFKEEGVEVELEVAFGRPATSILQFSSREKIDLIILSTHGEGGARPYAFGGTADRIVRRSTIPVLILRPEEVTKLLPIPSVGDDA